ncbi:MAG: YitT family protein [Dorea sp.]|nr:YitT family protein [Dorea sp.]
MLGKMDIRKRETVTQASLIVIGSLAYSIGLNMLITPLALYNGGFMGIAQLIRTFLVSVLHIKMPPGMDIAGAIYYILNVPLFYMGYRIMGKGFFVKSLFGTTVISIFLVLVPVPATPIIEDYLTACIIGGIIAGFGSGVILRGRGTAGGPDIIGVCCLKKRLNISVGQVNIFLNLVVYGICLFMFDIEIVIYSLIYATVFALTVDKIHIQNINMSVMIFTKKLGISQAIMEQTGRGVTTWDGEGAYTRMRSYILFVMISKYEVGQIKQIVHGIDPNAFMILTEGSTVIGNFEKRL